VHETYDCCICFSLHSVYEVRPRKDKCGVDLISASQMPNDSAQSRQQKSNMADRGNRPKPDPLSECPNPECRRRFLASVERCPFCGLKRGDLENRARAAEYQAKRKARELASKTAIDASPSRPDKDLLSKADSLLTLPADQLQDKVDKYLGAVRDFQLETDENGKPDRVSLARLVGRRLRDILDSL
jgi:hypothetical protein